MNCEGINRIIEDGNLDTLSASEMSEADAHAQSCGHCAPRWLSHTRLAAASIPSMPPELSARCLAALRSQNSAPRHAPRRVMFVVGGLVALAAAASMLTLNIGNEPGPQPQEVVSAVLPAAAPAEALPAEIIPESHATPEVAEPAARKYADYSLPLLPAPIDAEKEMISRIDLAMRKALDLYPEITSGPESKDHFVVMLALREDGTVLRNSMVIATSADEVNAEMRKAQTAGGTEQRFHDGSPQTFTGKPRGSRMPDGRILRGDLTVGFSMVRNNYDLSRSTTRVEEIIRAERSHLMLPISSGGINTLTVLLSEDGTIQKEHVEFIGVQQLMQSAQSGRSDDADSRAQDMARKLGIGVDQIGLMGVARLQDGSVESPGARRVLTVDYAWARKAGEAAPRYGQGGYNSRLTNAIDTDIALKIVERMLPEAFVPAAQNPRSDGRTNMPAVVLSSEGRVLGAGRMNMVAGEAMRQEFQRIVPGVEIYITRSATLLNSAGDRADVQFAWEATPAQKLELENARKAP